ncbi:uncharacterized protein Xport-B [Chelonus insularis]|uniref:uncharacterized protein Xport-B n=1 Tax=Chelonus insularis TaxID=460826 RepID=UPI0015889C64|nr:uncharacterized protein LOC118072234 [Chelonus insularis]
MIALVIRGFVLVGVLGWYSASVWKMIDGYFKDKFDKYLQEEYVKNPLMKKNLQERQTTLNDKSINQLNEHPIDPITIRTENENKSDSTTISANNVFLGHQSMNNHSQPLPTLNNSSNGNLVLNAENIEIKKHSEEYFDGKSSKLQSKKQTSNKKREKIVLTASEPLKKKKKIQTIMLSKEDFKSASIKAMKDFDFSEFENDAEDSQYIEGSIPVASLSYKPKADIGDLDRITDDEYCPINSNKDQEECRVRKKWP